MTLVKEQMLVSITVFKLGVFADCILHTNCICKKYFLVLPALHWEAPGNLRGGVEPWEGMV